MKKIAVVILNWNGYELLEQFLPTVISFSPQANIYVADNGSSDNSVDFIKTNYPEINIIQNKENFGFAQGYNNSLKFVKEPFYALINSDIRVTENWLSPILELFQNESETAIIQPKILDLKNQDFFEYAGAAGGFIDCFGFPFCRGRVFENIEKDLGQYNDECTIFWASGACFFIRKSVFEELKGFDIDFFAHQEEIDLCWRAFNKGYITKYTSKSVVYHLGGGTLDYKNPKKTFLNFRNSLFMLIKNLPKKRLFPVLFVRLSIDGLAGIYFLSKGKFSHFIAIIKAHFYFYLLFPKNYKKRENLAPKKYYTKKSIVYEYFILKNVLNSISKCKN